MKVFVTGGSGFVGSAVIRELVANGHQVVGLARSDAAATAIMALGGQVKRGSLQDLESLQSGAANADGVIHIAFSNVSATTNFADSAAADGSAIETMGRELAGSHRPLVVTTGIAYIAPGRVLTENQAAPAEMGRFSERAALEQSALGVRASVMRLAPSVHGEGDHGFVPDLINLARAKGVAAYVGAGSSRWGAVHRVDAARLYRLALESAPAGTRLHAFADEGVTMREIAQVIGRRLNIPVVSLSGDQAAEHFTWLNRYVALDMQASSVLTQERFGWYPTQPSLLTDLDNDYYFN